MKPRSWEIRNILTDKELLDSWCEFFFRSLASCKEEVFEVVVHGSDLWNKCVRPWMQKNIFFDDRELFTIILVKYQGNKEVGRKRVKI